MLLKEEGLFSGINRPADADNLTDLEKRHLPMISAPDRVKAGKCFEATVEVGKLLEHPQDHSHFIQFIELYAGHVYVARLLLTAAMTRPILKVRVRLDRHVGPLRALALCNMHGTWECTKDITVV